MKQYIVIVGGQLHNKGAQAMSFTVVNEIKNKYPDKEAVLFASVYDKRDKIEKEYLNFKIFPWSIREQMDILGLKTLRYVGFKEYIKFLIKGSRTSNKDKKVINTILDNCILMVDVSGYALSSQRGYNASIKYLFNIMIAEMTSIPMVLFPQSFGPFNYDKKDMKKISPLLNKYLKYPKRIFAREYEGIKSLEQFNLDIVEKSMDSVLQSDLKLKLDNIYNVNAVKQQFQILENIKIRSNSVAIVPNDKVMIHGDEVTQYRIYESIINHLLKQNINVYLIRHSYEDLKICRMIKLKFKDESRVILLEEDFNCIQIDNLLAQFNFLVASRYHAIIHAYKNNTPALVFGWAIKYQELLSFFSQEKYLFDVREQHNNGEVLNKLNDLLDNHSEESRIIKQKMKELPKNELLNL